jgi:catechol 2,3-dioxygenase-like lactoylglutathione lyase family enzyme
VGRLLKIDNIMYRVTDLEAAARFYASLGLREKWRDGDRQMIGFVFPHSDSELVIHTDPTIPEYDYSFLVDDVERFCGEFAERGLRVQMEPIDVRPGKYAVLLDPDGNRIPIIDLTRFGGIPTPD